MGARADGSLRLRFRWHGKARAVATGLANTPGNRKTLEPLRDLVAATIHAGQDPMPVLRKAFPRFGDQRDESATLGPTLADYAKNFIAQRTPVVRKAQARDYRRHLLRYVVPVLGHSLLTEMRASDVRGLQAELLSRGLSVKYVKNIISGSFRAMIQQAKVDELVTRDIFAGLRWPRWRPPEPDPFTPDERPHLGVVPNPDVRPAGTRSSTAPAPALLRVRPPPLLVRNAAV